jgi:ferredoxin
MRPTTTTPDETEITMRVRVDRELCLGTGQCVLTAPAVFDQDDDDGTALVLVETVESAQEELIRRAVVACPAQAISVE